MYEAREGRISPPATKRRRLSYSNAQNDVNDTAAITTTNDSTASHDPSSIISVYAWNINGIEPFIQRSITSFFKGSGGSSSSSSKTTTTLAATDVSDSTEHAPSLRAFLRRHDWPTMLFLQEVKINPSDTRTQRAVEQAVRAPMSSSDTSSNDHSLPALDPEPDYTAHFSLPTDKHNARGFGRKVYGVCSIIRTDFLTKHNARVRTVDWDREGRFLVVETDPRPPSACSPGNSTSSGNDTRTNSIPKLSIWNIYAVNGTDAPYKDPVTGSVTGTRHDRKLAVHALLLDECQRLEREGYSVILAGDMNIARDSRDGLPSLRTFPLQHVLNRADFNAKFFGGGKGEDGDVGGEIKGQSLRAIDTFRHLHAGERRYTYHPRGRPWGTSCDRVDLIICSRSLASNLVVAGMLDSAAERGPSDHCPLFASFAFGEEGSRQ